MADRTLGRGFAAWSVDRETVAGLRRDRASDALAAGDHGLALAEAEELLDEHPDDVEALRVSSQAAMALGDPLMAALCCEGILSRRPDDARAWVELALARLHLADLQASQDAVDKGLELDSDLALGWHLLGILRQRTGQPGADQAHAHAARLQPERFPLPRPLLPATRKRALARALEALHPTLQDFYARVPVRWEPSPQLQELHAWSPPLSPLSPALVLGELPSGDPWAELPQAVRLYADNLAWPPAELDELADRIAAALTAVAVDWLGEEPDPLG